MVTFSAVLFDLDGTLHDRAETVRRYLAGHMGRFDLPHGYAERWTVLDDYGYRSKTEVFPQLVAEFRLKHDPQVLLQDFSDHAWADCQLMPHSHEVLTELRQCGLKLGLVTNGRSIRRRLTAQRCSGAATIRHEGGSLSWRPRPAGAHQARLRSERPARRPEHRSGSYTVRLIASGP